MSVRRQPDAVHDERANTHRAPAVLPTNKRVPHSRYRNVHLPLDQLRGQPEHPISEALKHSIPPRIRILPPRVPPAIDLHDQARRRSHEVHDEAAKHDLPAKLHAEPAPAQTPPQGGLARGGRVPHALGTLREQLRALRLQPSVIG